MQKYNDAMAAAMKEGRPEWALIQRWIERFICGTSALQNIVGHRDHPHGGKITQAQFDAGEKFAHVCPFVRDSIDSDLFYIEESPETEILKIRKLILARIDAFKQAEPAYDPATAGKPAPMPIALKVLLLVFPQYHSPAAGPDHAVEQIFKWMVTHVMRQGMMIGQFYKGCEEPAVHNPNWKRALTSPYLAWVLRYMNVGDKLFIHRGTTGYPIYQKLFPNDPHSLPEASGSKVSAH